MTTGFTERVREIAELQGIPKSAIREQALERGVEDLWITLVLSGYVTNETNQETTIELVSRDCVERVEHELQAVEANVRWGLRA